VGQAAIDLPKVASVNIKISRCDVEIIGSFFCFESCDGKLKFDKLDSDSAGKTSD